jgi:hypothetical protein
MQYYSLYNKRLDRKLKHPKIGIWYSNDLKEAEEMLKACKGYLDSSGLSDFKDNFVIIDETTGKEIPPSEDT